MKAALRLLLVTTTLVLAGPAFAEVLPTAKPETVDVSPDRLSRIRTVLQKEIDADRMPGAVVMIARRGQLIYSEAIGFQDKAAGKPMTKDAIFRIYSMTKPLAPQSGAGGAPRHVGGIFQGRQHRQQGAPKSTGALKPGRNSGRHAFAVVVQQRKRRSAIDDIGSRCGR